ncbi:MAG: adenylyltransferase/cytidyltransferase family protein [bacterium]
MAGENKKPITVAISGGFDPIHFGHVRMIQEARALGDRLLVIINNDNWLKKKKGFVFMPEAERQEVMEAIKGVSEVVLTEHLPDTKDMTICDALQKYQPDIFANGGDRDKKDADNQASSLNPEQLLCQELGIKMVFNVGRGGKVQSSSELVKKYSHNRENQS